MPAFSADQLKQHKAFVTSLRSDREPWLKLWRELSDNYLPQRYRWLLSAKEYTSSRARRQHILNNTGTLAARILASGMMNGITSPARPWFKLRVPGMNAADAPEVSAWLEEVERVMLRVMAESNFYNSMAVLYMDLAVFGSAATIIYEDYETVIRCYNPPVGEFAFGNDERGVVNILSRLFEIPVHQYIRRWPDKAYWSDRVKQAVRDGGKSLNMMIKIEHFVAPNHSNIVPKRFSHYELYWESQRAIGEQSVVLEKRGYHEKPGIFSRWEVSGTDAYGVSPGMDALGDALELQRTHRDKAELMEKQSNPPMLFDTVLANSPTALMPRGKTFVPNLENTSGARPMFTVNPNFAEINNDQVSTEQRIRNAFFNYLFTGISDLPTVRSATEIDSRESEKLILLGGVLERLSSEGLDPAMKRIYSISERAGLFPPPPEGLENTTVEVQYVSVLSVAQRAVGTAPTERWLEVIGNLVAVFPEVKDLSKLDSMLKNYARDIGIRESELMSEDEIAETRQARVEAENGPAEMEQLKTGADAGKVLSETDVGGGANALQMLMGQGGV